MGQADGSLPHLPCCGLLADKGIEVDIVPPEAVDSVADYGAVVLGSAVYNGHWLIPARGLAARFRDTHPRDHHVFAGRLDPQFLSLAQRATLLVSRAMPGTSATGPRSGNGPTASQQT